MLWTVETFSEPNSRIEALDAPSCPPIDTLLCFSELLWTVGGLQRPEVSLLKRDSL